MITSLKQKFLSNYPSTISIIAICIFMFVVSIFIDIALGGNLNFAVILHLAGGESVPAVLEGQIWRFVTAAFLHGDIIHIAFNVYALWFLGRYVETFFGSKKTLIVFLISAVGGGLLSFGAGVFGVLFNFSANTFVLSTVSVGASGGVFGFIGLLLGNKLRRDPFSPEIPVDQTSLIIIVIANFIYGLTISGIDNFGHLGGLLAGIALAYMMRPTVNFADDKSKAQVITNVAFYSSIFIIFVSFLAHLIYSIFYFVIG